MLNLILTRECLLLSSFIFLSDCESPAPTPPPPVDGGLVDVVDAARYRDSSPRGPSHSIGYSTTRYGKDTDMLFVGGVCTLRHRIGPFAMAICVQLVVCGGDNAYQLV